MLVGLRWTSGLGPWREVRRVGASLAWAHARPLRAFLLDRASFLIHLTFTEVPFDAWTVVLLPVVLNHLLSVLGCDVFKIQRPFRQSIFY